MNDSSTVDSDWRAKAFEKHRREQMRRMAALPLWEKIAWLEEAHHLVLQIQKSREKAEEPAT